jgi:uncharacterized protein (TIGR02246 family)
MATSDAETLWKRIELSNAAWMAGHPEDVAPIFAQDVVMEGSDGRVVARGRDAMVASYIEYCRQVRTHAFAVREHAVHLFGDTAVVTYAFEVTNEANGHTSRESGTERLVFSRRDGEWRAVWRLQTTAPAT